MLCDVSGNHSAEVEHENSIVNAPKIVPSAACNYISGMSREMSPKVFALEQCNERGMTGIAQDSDPKHINLDSDDGKIFVNNNEQSKLCNDDEFSELFNKTESPAPVNVNKRLYYISRSYRLAGKAYGKHLGKSIECNKVSAYKTDLAKKRYVFPAPGQEAQIEEIHQTDNRNILEVFRDIIGILMDQYSPDDLDFLSRCVGYDVSVPQYSSTGVPMTQSLLNVLIREYKQVNGFKNVNKCLEEFATRVEEAAEEEEPLNTDLANSIYSCETIDLEGCCSFISKNKWLLKSANQRKLYRNLKSKLRANKSPGAGKVNEFVKHLHSKYFNSDTGEWEAPQATPDLCPGQCFLAASGKPLYFMQGWVSDVKGNDQKFQCLVDNGSTHDLLPISYVQKFNLKIGPIKKRGNMHMFTAGAEIKNSIVGEALVEVKIKVGSDHFVCNIPFLVVNDNLNIRKPVLGNPFLFQYDCEIYVRGGYVKGKLKCSKGNIVEVILPRVDPSDGLSVCNAMEGAWGEYEDKIELNLLDGSPKTFSVTEEASNLESLKATCLLAYGSAPADRILSSLGGNTADVDLEVRDSLDEAIFDRMDLLSVLEKADRKQPEAVQDPKVTIPDKYYDEINQLKIKYPQAFSSDTQRIGTFKGYMYYPNLKPNSRASQENRNQDFSLYPAAVSKMKEMEDLGIIQVSDSQSRDFVHNLLLQHKKKTNEAGRHWTKADAYIQGRKAKLTDPDVKIRCINDLTTLNECLESVPSIILPSEAQVKKFVSNKLITLLDLKDMFYSIRICPTAYHFFNFYYLDTIYNLTRLAQGLGSSPYVATEALKSSLTTEVWISFLSQNQNRLKLLKKFYNDYSKIQISFIDDMAIGSLPLCKCPGQTCTAGFDCPTFDVDTSATLHVEVVEAVIFALNEAGFLVAENKFEPFVQNSFIFLGTHYDATTSEYGIALDRAQSILKFRIPRSIPELGSRLSTIFYSCPHLPAIRKLALPLTKVVYQNKFQWGQREMRAYNNCKLAVSLCVALLHIFDPNRHGILISDSSKHCASYTFYQISSQGIMVLVATETKVLSGNESRHVAIYRELLCLVWAVSQIERYILASNKHILVMGDAQSILFIRQAKSWIGKLGEIQLYLSKFNNLTVTFLPGRFLALPDDFSRQFSAAYIHKQDAPLSRIMSDILPPIPTDVREKVFQMSAAELTDYLRSENAPCKIDIWDKSEYITQTYRESDLKALLKETQPLQIFLKWLKNPYDVSNLDTKATKEFFSVLTGSSKTKIDAWIKDIKLDHLKKALSKIDYNSSWRVVFGLNGKNVSTNMVTTRSARKSSVACPIDPSLVQSLSEKEINCVHREDMKNNCVFTVEQLREYCGKIGEWNDLVYGLKNVVGILTEIGGNRTQRDKLLNALTSYSESTCLILKFATCKSIIMQLNQLNISKEIIHKMVGGTVMMYSYLSEDWNVTERKNELVICTKRELVLDGLEYIQMDGWTMVLSEDVYLEQCWPADSKIKVYLNVTELHVACYQSLAIFNTDIEKASIPKGSALFSIKPKTNTNQIWFAKMDPNKASSLMGIVTNVVENVNCNRFTDLMTDYLIQLHCTIINPVLSDEEITNNCNVSLNTLTSTCPQVLGGDRKYSDKSNYYHNQHQLSVMLFAHRLRTKNGIISKQDLISLQNSDSFLQKIKSRLNQEITQEGETSGLFVLEQGVLYRNSYMERFGITFLCPAIPYFLCKQILINLHSVFNLHIGTQEMYTLLRVSVYCYNMIDLVKQARLQCPVCIYSHQSGKRKLYGDKLLWKSYPPKAGSFAQIDLVFLAHNVEYNASALLTFVDCLTKYFIAVPIYSKAETHIIKALSSIYSVIPLSKVLQVDSGSEFISGKVRSFLDELGIEIYFAPTKDSQAIIENANRIFKATLNSCIQKLGLTQNQWGKVLVHSLQLMNSRPPGRGSLLSRHQLFFSPLHYIPPQYLSVSFPENCNMPKLHITHYKLLHEPKVRLKARKGIVNPHLTKGKIVRTEVARVDQTGAHGQQLLPSTDKFLKIHKVLSGGNVCVAKDLLDGNKNKYSAGQLRSLGQLDFPFPNEAVRVRNVFSTIPPVHGVAHARKLSAAEQPHMFSVGGNSGKETVVKSILKVKTGVLVQPLKGKLRASVTQHAPNGGIDQLRAYYWAADNLRWIRHYTKDKTNLPKISDWLLNLEAQSDSFGCNISLRQPDVLPPVHSGHGRTVRFLSDTDHEKPKGKTCCNMAVNFMWISDECISFEESRLINKCCLNYITSEVDLELRIQDMDVDNKLDE